MYRVKIFAGPEDKKGTIIHSPKLNELKLDEGSIQKAINKIDSFDFSFNPYNPGYGKIKPILTLLNVFNTKTNKYEFEGRVLTPSDEMSTSEEFSRSFICEGELGYLHDAPQQHVEYRGNVYNLLKIQLDCYNSQVEPYKRFYIGNVTVEDPNDFVYLYLSDEKSTFDSIQDTLINRYGGELQIRKVNGVRYLDYLERIGYDSPVEIRLAKNLLSISRKVDPTSVVSRLKPLGARIASEDESATDASQARITIDSVNNGLPYIDRQDLIDEFGIRGGTQVFDDVNSATLVKSKGLDWLNKQKTILSQYTVGALDLSKIGLDIEGFDVGNTHQTINPVMTINERLRIIGKTIDINAPEEDKLTIGDKFKTANEYQSDLNKSNQKVVELQELVENQSTRLVTLAKDYVAISQNIEKVQLTLTNINAENLPQELQNINDVLEGIQESIEELPIYDLATSEIAGLMSSEDKNKLDDLKKYNVATISTNGLMSKEDKAALNKSVIDIGNTALLNTVAKSDLVAAINEINTKLIALEP